MFRLSSQAVLGWLTSRKSHSRNKREPAHAPGTALAALQLEFQLTLVVNESPSATATQSSARRADPDEMDERSRSCPWKPWPIIRQLQPPQPSCASSRQLRTCSAHLNPCSEVSNLIFCVSQIMQMGAPESQGSRVPHEFWHEKEQQLALNSLYQPVISELSPAALQLEALLSRRTGEQHFAHAHINQVILWAAESVKLYLPWSSVVMTVFDVASLVSNNTVIFLQWMHSRHFFSSACLLPQHL